ncbi:hypothetical protein B7H23_02055 [Notoacmeibacter marinus]|uniref:EF-hand domain-containing protein n=2 Tax=Notoacmeibacter marinus TaxID=1876515 RepID=A0A231V403_9HYPH|nr:hypothetical protein B7H23_02055 [Notoacmeibacter marinus]
MKKFASIVATTAFLAVPAAFAQDVFTAADVDGSGDLSAAEVAAIAPDMTPEAMAQYDTDGSGTLSREEFEASPLMPK